MATNEMDGARPATRRKRNGLAPYDLVSFLIPASMGFVVQKIGMIYGSDFLIIFFFLILAFQRRLHLKSTFAKRFVFYCSLWLASQCVTDIVRRSAFEDYARGWSNIGLTIVTFILLNTMLNNRPRRLLLYGWGLAIGFLLDFWLNPTEMNQGDPWKFGYAFPISLCFFLLASRPRHSNMSAVMLGAVAGLLNIVLGARSEGGVCLAATLYLFLKAVSWKRRAAAQMKVGSVVALSASIVLGAAAILWVYQSAARRGVLGNEAREKYEIQSSGKWGLLLGGRTEVLGSLPAIYDSPILGHGSRARDPYYLFVEHRLLAMMGYDTATDLTEDSLRAGYIPTHSHLLGAWVTAGALGALFWAWVLGFSIKTLLDASRLKRSELLPIVAYFVFSLDWDILFSPYGSGRRFVVPFGFVLMMTVRTLARRQEEALHARKQPSRRIRKVTLSVCPSEAGPA